MVYVNAVLDMMISSYVDLDVCSVHTANQGNISESDGRIVKLLDMLQFRPARAVDTYLVNHVVHYTVFHIPQSTRLNEIVCHFQIFKLRTSSSIFLTLPVRLKLTGTF